MVWLSSIWLNSFPSLPKRCPYWLTDMVCELCYPPDHSWESFLGGRQCGCVDVHVFGSWIVSSISGTYLKAYGLLSSIAQSSGWLFVCLKIHLGHGPRGPRGREALVASLERGWEGTAAPCFSLWEMPQAGRETVNLAGGLCLRSRSLLRQT